MVWCTEGLVGDGKITGRWVRKPRLRNIHVDPINSLTSRKPRLDHFTSSQNQLVAPNHQALQDSAPDNAMVIVTSSGNVSRPVQHTHSADWAICSHCKSFVAASARITRSTPTTHTSNPWRKAFKAQLQSGSACELAN